MSFTRANPSGWGTGGQVTSGQLNQIDINQANAIDGAAGGTYAPSGALVLGGSGVTLSGANHAVASGGTLTVANGGTCTVASGGVCLVVTGGLLTVTGSLNVAAGGTLTMQSGNKVSLSSRSLTRSVTPVGNTYVMPVGAVSFAWQGVTAYGAIGPLDNVPNGATITGIAVTVMGVLGGTATTIPTTRIQLSLQVITSATGAYSTFGTTNDPSATPAAYVAVHTISATGLSVVVDKSVNRYALYVSGPVGGDTATGTVLYGFQVTFTTTAMDDGAG
jgi:hypothetical protein